MKMRLWYSVFFAFTLIYSVEAQQLMGEKLAGLVQVDTFPSRLLQTRTAVLLGGDIKNQQEWERITGIIHDNLRKPGIDAVAYYRIEQIYAGVEVTRSFALDLMKREINNLVLVNYKPDISQVAILVPDYTKGLVTPQQPAWMASGRLDRVMFQVYAQSANAKLVRTNFLVNDLPEDGLMTDPISGRRAQFFSLTLNEGKMAVPQWGKATEDSLLVETLRQHYPYEFGLVDALDSDVELTRMGYSYVFRYVEGPGELVKDLLKYSKEQGVTDYVTIKWRNDASAVKTIPITDKVFKFYIKHLRSGTTFLGTEWDADISWQEALINHINSFKHEVGVQ